MKHVVSSVSTVGRQDDHAPPSEPGLHLPSAVSLCLQHVFLPAPGLLLPLLLLRDSITST